jgi:LPS O-antigen subunit length determinant protein (WzzB/FepE family)
MKKKLTYIADDEIDLSEIIKKIWNYKILILSISLFFMVIGYVYGALQPKIYKTEITIREAPSYLFDAYSSFFSIQQKQQGMAAEFNYNLKLNLLSLDTLVQFVEKNNTINDFKNHLKEKNISVEKYFQPDQGTRKLESVIELKNKIPNKYSLTYTHPLPGEAFLNDYVIFVQQKTVNMFKQQLVQSIINEISIHQNHLEIAKKIALENPILQSMLENENRKAISVSALDGLYYKGTKVITQQIIYLNKLLNEVENLTLDYDLILEQASSETLIIKSPTTYALITFLFGLFFSLMIALTRSLTYK